MTRRMIHDKCKDSKCKKIIEMDGDLYCKVYINPSYWWTDSGGRVCPMAVRSSQLDAKKPRNPLKKDTPLMPKSPRSDWPGSGIKTPKRLKYRKGYGND